jgi:uncharacterized protein
MASGEDRSPSREVNGGHGPAGGVGGSVSGVPRVGIAVFGRIALATVVLGLGSVATSSARAQAPSSDAAVRSVVVPTASLSTAAKARIPKALAGFKQIRLVVIAANGKERYYCAALADTPESHQQGLMGRRDIAGHAAMVFLFEEEQQGAFWMRTVPISLDIAWFDRRGRWADGITMAPCGDDPNCPVYPSAKPYQFAVETLPGDAKKLGLVSGSRIRLDGRCR